MVSQRSRSRGLDAARTAASILAFLASVAVIAAAVGVVSVVVPGISLFATISVLAIVVAPFAAILGVAFATVRSRPLLGIFALGTLAIATVGLLVAM